MCAFGNVTTVVFQLNNAHSSHECDKSIQIGESVFKSSEPISFCFEEKLYSDDFDI